jgi:NOL1/NOP2/fmu family ribosome biogenesis protein
MQVKKIKPAEIERLLEKNYGSACNLRRFDVYMNKEGKLFLAYKGLPKHMVQESMYCLHFGTIKRNGKVHLTIEGSQMVGPTATKNLVVVDEENAYRFMEGLPTKPVQAVGCEAGNFVIVKFGTYFLGSGVMRQEFLEGYVPKERRLQKTLKG